MLNSSHLRRTLLLAGLFGALSGAADLGPMRPPAVPLIAHDPYFSIWSMADQLNSKPTDHWTGKPSRLTAYARIDGKTFRLMGGAERRENPTPALEQKSLEVLPTRTTYRFGGAGVDIGLTFLTPALPDDLDVLSRPLTYVSFTAAAQDGQSHSVAVFFDALADTVVNTPDEKVWTARYLQDGQPVLRMGSRAQPLLQKSGDDLRIDWGYLYLAADKPEGVTEAALTHAEALASFSHDGRLPRSDDFSEGEGRARRDTPALAFAIDLGAVREQTSRYLMIAYDDLYSIEYFQRKLRPWWRRNGMDAAALLLAGRRDHDALASRCERFDRELMDDMTREGGEEYARIGSLAYRQTLAAYKLVADLNGHPLFFPKENFSNGCIATVDVIYPAAPFALLFNPKLLEAQLEPVLEYSQMGRWRWPFAPHDLGTYPLADGQVYGGGELTEENQMPVEETGNMLILLDALAKVEGNAKFSLKYWPELTKWAGYLKEKGLDPENQLSTDDFAGHLAHNANLSIKAILALAAYGDLAGMTNHAAEATEYKQLAKQFAAKWQKLAAEGDHYRLAFDQPATWSQKYNLVWDQLLGLHVFPPQIAQQEIRFYDTKLNKYGLPLDSRKDYTKLDWIVWTATMAQDRAGFEKIVDPAYSYLQESPTRVPMSDWYDTKLATKQGFQARSVVGGVFIKMLADPAMWKKYSQAGLNGEHAARLQAAPAQAASNVAVRF